MHQSHELTCLMRCLWAAPSNAKFVELSSAGMHESDTIPCDFSSSVCVGSSKGTSFPSSDVKDWKETR